jgi:hypothetical protein
VKKSEVEHVLRAAGAITGETQFIIIGRQSIDANYPDQFVGAKISFELDLFAKNRPERTEDLNAIGQESQFHESFGYYADPVDSTTAVLPKDWKGRLVNLPVTNTNGVTGLCLDPLDLLISKYAARQEKDVEFNREVMAAGVIDVARLLALVELTPVDDATKLRMRSDIEHDQKLTGNIKGRNGQTPIADE